LSEQRNSGAESGVLALLNHHFIAVACGLQNGGSYDFDEQGPATRSSCCHEKCPHPG